FSAPVKRVGFAAPVKRVGFAAPVKRWNVDWKRANRRSSGIRSASDRSTTPKIRWKEERPCVRIEKDFVRIEKVDLAQCAGRTFDRVRVVRGIGDLVRFEAAMPDSS